MGKHARSGGWVYRNIHIHRALTCTGIKAGGQPTNTPTQRHAIIQLQLYGCISGKLGQITGTQLWQDLKLENRLGVTRGQMELSGERKVFPRSHLAS